MNYQLNIVYIILAVMIIHGLFMAFEIIYHNVMIFWKKRKEEKRRKC